jgi:subtilase family protein
MKKRIGSGMKKRAAVFTSVTCLGVFSVGFASSPAVKNSATRHFPYAMPGKSIKILKTWDPETQTARVISEDGVTIRSAEELVRLEEAELNLFREKYGRLSHELSAKYDKLDSQDTLRVIVTLKPPVGITYLPKFGHSMEELKANSLAIAAVKPSTGIETVLLSNNISSGTKQDDFASIVTITKKQLTGLLQDKRIASIDEYKDYNTVGISSSLIMAPSFFQQTSIDLVTLARSAYSHSQTALPSNIGNNVKAATFESGLTSSFLNCLGVSPIQWDAQTVPFSAPGTSTADHGLATFTNLVNAAPGARYYHRFSWDYFGSSNENYIINNGLKTISMSTNSGGTTPLGSNNMIVDDFAYRYPFPVFSNPTGNNGWFAQPNWACYNAMSVGNVQDWHYTNFRIDDVTCGAGATQTKNPNPIYSGCIDGGTYPNCAGDREMPYIVAPGYTPFADHSLPPNCYMLNVTPMKTSCFAEDQLWGTSMSAPTLSGMAASLIGQVPSIASQPEAVRAILMLTARNVKYGYWSPGTDGLDGAGVVHGQDAISFAQSMVSVSPNNTAEVNGVYYASLSQADFTPSPVVKYFNIKIPASLPANKHLRIVLTWDSSPDIGANVNDLSDFDLSFNNGWQWSSSWDANVETIDVPAANVTPNATYNCGIHPYTWRHHANARSSLVYTSLTWGWVTDHAH